MLDGGDLELRALVFGQGDGAAVAARDHHHIAHEFARLVGEAIAGAELEQGRGIGKLAEFVNAGAVLMPADAFGLGGLRRAPGGLQDELVAVEGADFGEDGGMVDEIGEVGLEFEAGADLMPGIAGGRVQTFGSGERCLDFGGAEGVLDDDVAEAFEAEAFVFGEGSGLGEWEHGRVSSFGFIAGD